MNTEIKRILNLKRRLLEDAAVDLTERYKRQGGLQRLRPLQSLALQEMEEYGGLLGPIGVGLGKALISFLAPAALGSKRPVVLVPAGVYPQSVKMYSEARENWNVPQLTIVPYSRLSVASGATILEDLKPDCIIADEAHSLKSKKSARTMRLVRYFRENPSTKFVALSGTMTSRSLSEYGHLAELALREGSPLPRDKYTLAAWARILDAGSEPLSSDWSSFAPLMGIEIWDQALARSVFRDRLTQTPGVVCSSDDKVKASLRIVEHPDLPYPKDEYSSVGEGSRPDGHIFESDIEEWRCLRQLSLGFYYRWDWGDRDPDDEWVEARNNWGRFVRKELSDFADTNYDSPLLVARRLEETNARGHLADAWNWWKSVKDRPGPITVPVWLSKEALVEALTIVKGPALFWYESKAVAEALKGMEGVEVIEAGEEPPVDGKGRLALSIPSHGTGWNLQAWSQSVVLEPPANGQIWEQLIGRTHRVGQEADTVIVHVLQHTKVLRKSLDKARIHAKYIQQTQGLPQRLNYADFEGKSGRVTVDELEAIERKEKKEKVKPLSQLKRKKT